MYGAALGWMRLSASTRTEKSILLKALAVGTLILGGVGLMSAHADGIETAVVFALAVVCAGCDRADDGVVGSAAATVVGTSLIHTCVLP